MAILNLLAWLTGLNGTFLKSSPGWGGSETRALLPPNPGYLP